MGFAWPHGRGRRFKRGMLKYVVLKALESGEHHGYDLMKHFEENGWGRLAAGSMYPLLSVLEEAGFIEGRDDNGRRIYRITEMGRRRLDAVAGDVDEMLQAHRAQGHGPREHGEARQALQRLSGAVVQAAHSAKPETIEQIVARLDAVRKEIYTMLANE